MKEQAANKRPGPGPNPSSLRNRAKVAGLPYLQVYFRVHRLGWTESQALSVPIQPRGRISGRLKSEGYKLAPVPVEDQNVRVVNEPTNMPISP
jgi:hypothetical protein